MSIKRVFFLLSAVSASLHGAQKLEQKKNSAVQFVKDLDSYYIEPGWIVSYLQSLPLSDFDGAWQAFVTAFCYEPWRCFVVDKKEYSEKKYRDLLLAHCQQYDLFLKSMVVDIKSQKILLTQGKTEQLEQQGFVSVFQYWQRKNRKEYQTFYAFYFDRVAASFIETVSNAWYQIESCEYQELHKKALQLVATLYSIFPRLEGGPYDGKYAQHLQRYSQVIYLLEIDRMSRIGHSGL